MLGDTEFDNLLFLWYDEENQHFVELETEHDEENSTVSTTVTHFSKYMLVDGLAWYTNWQMISKEIVDKRCIMATCSLSGHTAIPARSIRRQWTPLWLPRQSC